MGGTLEDFFCSHSEEGRITDMMLFKGDNIQHREGKSRERQITQSLTIQSLSKQGYESTLYGFPMRGNNPA